MEDFTHMLKRARIQQLCAFLKDGVDLENWFMEVDDRPYEQRWQEGERPIWRLLEETFPDGKALDDAAEKLCRALEVNQYIFMEIGIKAGAHLVLELLRGNPAG